MDRGENERALNRRLRHDLDTPLNDVQKSLLAIAKHAEVAKPAAIFPKAAIADLQRKAATEAKSQRQIKLLE